jgi:hypothetical protein
LFTPNRLEKILNVTETKPEQSKPVLIDLEQRKKKKLKAEEEARKERDRRKKQWLRELEVRPTVATFWCQ